MCQPSAYPWISLFTPKGFDIKAQGKRSAALGSRIAWRIYPEGVSSKGSPMLMKPLRGKSIVGVSNPGRRYACPGLRYETPFGVKTKQASIQRHLDTHDDQIPRAKL